MDALKPTPHHSHLAGGQAPLPLVESLRAVDTRIAEALNVVHLAAKVINPAADLFESPFVGNKDGLIREIRRNAQKIDDHVTELARLLHR